MSAHYWCSQAIVDHRVRIYVCLPVLSGGPAPGQLRPCGGYITALEYNNHLPKAHGPPGNAPRTSSLVGFGWVNGFQALSVRVWQLLDLGPSHAKNRLQSRTYFPVVAVVHDMRKGWGWGVESGCWCGYPGREAGGWGHWGRGVPSARGCPGHSSAAGYVEGPVRIPNALVLVWKCAGLCKVLTWASRASLSKTSRHMWACG
jgi:hypothetical protein